MRTLYAEAARPLAPEGPRPTSSAMPPALEFENVVKRFGDRRALDGVSFQVEPGEVFGLLGPNGAGKTTLIRLALDILRPDEGVVRLLGEDVRDVDHDRVAYLPEERGLYRREKVRDVLAYLARLKGVAPREARRRAGMWLERVGLSEVAHKRVDQLSKGMSQKAQIAASLVADPELAILDEPFSGLDPVHVGEVLLILRERQDAGRTTVLSTHLMNRVEAVCDRVALLHQGRRVRYGTVGDIRGAQSGVTVRVSGSLPDVEGVVDAVAGPGGHRLTLSAPPAEVLARLLAAGAEVLCWEIERPSLEDVFVSVVAGQDEDAS
ncbi:MAG: ABC transporter ATP-binding protein [Sandaracinaceae bacterium]